MDPSPPPPPVGDSRPVIILFEESPGRRAESTGPSSSALMLQPDFQLFLPLSCLGMLAPAGTGFTGHLEEEKWLWKRKLVSRGWRWGGQEALIVMCWWSETDVSAPAVASG